MTTPETRPQLESSSDEENLQLYYGGEKSQINAETLVYSLIEVTKLIQEINTYTTPERKIEVNVNAVGEGSFILHIGVLSTATDVLQLIQAHKEGLGILSSLITILGGLLAFAKFLRGNPPAEIKKLGDKQIQVTNRDGQVHVTDNSTYNIFVNDEKVQKSLARQFGALSDDPSIETFELRKDSKKKGEPPEILFSANREEFLTMGSYTSEGPNTRVVNVASASVSILKIVFEAGRKWEFLYAGRKISAYISDQNFFKEHIDK